MKCRNIISIWIENPAENTRLTLLERSLCLIELIILEYWLTIVNLWVLSKCCKSRFGFLLISLVTHPLANKKCCTKKEFFFNQLLLAKQRESKINIF